MPSPDDTSGWAYAPPSHLEGEPSVPIPDQPPGAEIPANRAVRLPSGVFAYRQTYAERDRLAELARQALAAKEASLQAAMDAKMFAQMSRVATSMKDIEIARRSIDVMGLQRDIQSGVPIHQAVARHPMALGSGYGSALQHTAPAPVVPAPSVVNLPGLPAAIQTTDRYGQRHVQFPPAPPISLQQAEARTAQPITTPEGKVIAYDAGGGKTIAQPKPPPEGKLTDQQKARLSDLRKQRDVITREMGEYSWQARVTAGGPANEKYIADKNAEAAKLDNEIAKIEGIAPSAPAPKGPTGQILPLPKNRAELVLGGLYDTNKGVARWNGTKFELVETK